MPLVCHSGPVVCTFLIKVPASAENTHKQGSGCQVLQPLASGIMSWPLVGS